jgi:transposase
VVTIQEAGRDGFWLHRLLEAHGVQSHVVDPASIAVSRRHRRAKTDRIDAEGLLRTLMAFARGERQVCSMLRPPTREAEDARRLTREREALLAERVRHTNRIKGLLATQGVFGFEPTWQARRARLEALRTAEGHELPPRLKAEIVRQIERLELILRQIAEVEAARDAALAAERQAGGAAAAPSADAAASNQAMLPAGEGAGARLTRLKGIGPETAAVLRLEAFHRSFGNRREVAAYAGLTPTPRQSGGLDTQQGISKAGNARLRRAVIQLAWFWLRNQPQSALSAWYRERVREGRGRIKRIAIVALARKLLIALWRFVTQGVAPSGAELKPAKAA